MSGGCYERHSDSTGGTYLRDLMRLVLIAVQEGRADNSHVALLLLLQHWSATGLLLDPSNGDVHVLESTLALFTVTRDNTVSFEWRTLEQELRLCELKATMEFFSRHPCAVGHGEVRDRDLPMIVPAPYTHEEATWLGRQDEELLKELHRAIASNGRVVPALSAFLPVHHLPEIISAMAYTTGFEVMCIVSARTVRQRSILPYLKRKRE